MFKLTPIDPSQADTDWKPLHLFNLYRFTVATVFLGSFLAGVSPSFLGRFDEHLFEMTSWFYSGFALLCEVTIRKRWPPFNIQVFGQVPIDILVITLLMHASGGVNSGLGMLLVVAVAGGSLLTEGRTAFFFAAVASLCVLIHVTIADIYDWFGQTSYTHAGMLGTTFFATAFLAFSLAQRVRASEILAKQRGEHLRYLAQLNAEIVERINAGIIVVDTMQRVRLFNEAARRLLGLDQHPEAVTLAHVAPELVEQLKQWQKTFTTTPSLFRPALGEVEVMVTFTALNQGGATSVLMVLEDATLTSRRAEQLKLTSLGRLAANIAHEIRNPLTAIRQAGQLLAEFAGHTNPQARLTEIIVNNSQRVNTIIENVLHFSRREPTNIQNLELHPWLHSFVEELLDLHGLPHTEVIIHAQQAPVTILFDPVQLYQVVSNLCENGLRYSRGTPLLEMTIGVGERPYLDIRDHGPGMTDEVKTQIFEPFFTTEKKGSGLGLYLSREICAANQASLHLFSNSNAGCCFRIHFAMPE